LGIPISLVGVFYYKIGIVGLWLGPSTAIIFNFIFYYMMVIKADWEKIAEEAEIRRFIDKE
jgi:Na+-driven multidrug efflux pump